MRRALQTVAYAVDLQLRVCLRIARLTELLGVVASSSYPHRLGMVHVDVQVRFVQFEVVSVELL
jgi:hypothetical protein